MRSVATAPGKIIIAGEHFCVHGQPAVAMALGLRSKVTVKEGVNRGILIKAKDIGLERTFSGEDTLQTAERGRGLKPIEVAVISALKALDAQRPPFLTVEVESKIPRAVGLGSSASIAVSTVAAVARFLSREFPTSKIIELAQEPEKLLHGNPSGIDQTAATVGGMILFKGFGQFQPLEVSGKLPLVVGNTRIRRSTGVVVVRFGERVRARDASALKAVEEGGGLVEEAARAIASGDLGGLGEVMNRNHRLLASMGLSHERLDRFVDAALAAGALGAKMTGGGGGGCMIALTSEEGGARVIDAIRGVGGEAFPAHLNREGVKVWVES